MADCNEAWLAKINLAGKAICEDLLHSGLDRAEEYASQFGIPESEMPLVLANAYFRAAVLTNSSALGLDDEDLAKRIMQAIKDTAREKAQP